MMCVLQPCARKGKKSNNGMCDNCRYEIDCGFTRSRQEAESLARMTGKGWDVCELDPTSKTSIKASKLGIRAFGVYPSGSSPRVIESYGPEGRTYQAPEAP